MESVEYTNYEGAQNSLEPWLELNNMVVMVTGSSSGLGMAFCLDLAKAGCRVIAAARRFDRLESLCNQINTELSPSILSADKDHRRAVPFELDVSASESVVEARVKQAWGIFGKIDCLINNAGIRERVHGPLDLKEEEWNNVIRTNQTGTWLLAKHVCIHMRDAKNGGSVINITSINGLDRVKYYGAQGYTASKTAVHGITTGMAMELGPYNIRVNAIAPGIFPSEITQGLVEQPWFRKVMSVLLPLRTDLNVFGGLTSLVRYLIHPSSKYVSGNIFIVEGGGTLPGVPIYSAL